MGDFNLDLLKLDINDYTNNFISPMFSSSFYHLITKPTRITGKTATLIDNIFVNKFDDRFKTGLLITDLSENIPVFQITAGLNQTETHVKKERKNA